MQNQYAKEIIRHRQRQAKPIRLQAGKKRAVDIPQAPRNFDQITQIKEANYAAVRAYEVNHLDGLPPYIELFEVDAATPDRPNQPRVSLLKGWREKTSLTGSPHVQRVAGSSEERQRQDIRYGYLNNPIAVGEEGQDSPYFRQPPYKKDQSPLSEYRRTPPGPRVIQQASKIPNVYGETPPRRRVASQLEEEEQPAVPQLFGFRQQTQQTQSSQSQQVPASSRFDSREPISSTSGIQQLRIYRLPPLDSDEDD